MYYLSLFSDVSLCLQFQKNVHLYIRCSQHENQEQVTHTTWRLVPHQSALRGLRGWFATHVCPVPFLGPSSFEWAVLIKVQGLFFLLAPLSECLALFSFT